MFHINIKNSPTTDNIDNVIHSIAHCTCATTGLSYGLQVTTWRWLETEFGLQHSKTRQQWQNKAMMYINDSKLEYRYILLITEQI